MEIRLRIRCMFGETVLWPFVVVVFEIVTMAVKENEHYLCEDARRMTTMMCTCSKREKTLSKVIW